jgi:hypothetical protein
VPKGIPHSTFLNWPTLDQDKAIAWSREQLKICGGCGTRKSEWERDRDAYIGHIEVCPGCERIAQEQENTQGMERKGLKIGLVPKGMETSGEELA